MNSSKVRPIRTLERDTLARVENVLGTSFQPTREEQMLAIVIDVLLEIAGRLGSASNSSAGDVNDDEPMTLAQVEAEYPALSNTRLYEAMAGNGCTSPLRYVQYIDAGTRFIRRGELRRWIRAHEKGGIA